MPEPKPSPLLDRRNRLGRQLPRSAKLIKGTLVTLARVCGKPNCRCNQGHKHKSLYLSKSHKGKTQMTYIPPDCEKEVREYIDRYKKWISVVNQLSQLNIDILKNRCR